MRSRPIRLVVPGLVVLLLVLLGLVAFYTRPTAGNKARSPAAAGTIAALAVDAGDGSLLAVRDGLVRSTDHGTSWQTLPVPAALHPANLRLVATTAAAPNRIYAAGPGAGIVRSDDAGKTWRAISSGLPSQQVTAFAVHAVQPDTLYAWIAGQGIFRTENGGGTWQKMDPGPPAHVVALIHSPLPGSMQTGWLYAATPQGPYLTMDCFCGWRKVGKLPSDAAAVSVAVDLKQPTRTYATSATGVFRSDDAGQTWHPADQGLPTNGLTALALDPRQPQRLYVATATGTLYVSDDGATSWRPLG